jgi:hypothetical protein
VPPLATTHIRPFAAHPVTEQGAHTVAQPLGQKLAPKLALNEQDITVPQLRRNRRLPIALGLVVSVLIVAAGYVQYRKQALERPAPNTLASAETTAPTVSAAARLEQMLGVEPEPAAQPETEVAGQPETEVAGQPETEVAGQPEAEVAGQSEPEVAVEPASDPAPGAPAPDARSDTASSDTESIAELEKKAIERMLANDHRAALTLYEELHRVAPQDEAYSVMSALLARRTRPTCEGGTPCDR